MADDARGTEGQAGGSVTDSTESAPVESSESPHGAVSAESGADEEIAAGGAEPAGSRRWPPLAVAVLGILVLVGLVGWLGFRTYQSRSADAERNLFLDVGRQGAVNLTTIDYEHVDDDVQRILDSTTGNFHDNFAKRSRIYIAAVKNAQSRSVGTIWAAGLESESRDEAKVAVAVNVAASSAAQPEQQPQAWRMRLTVQKVGDVPKIAEIEFVQ
jgi:Mce-associated membrane protein